MKNANNQLRNLLLYLPLMFSLVSCGGDVSVGEDASSLSISTLEFTLVNFTGDDPANFTMTETPPQAGSQLLFLFIPGALNGQARPEELIIAPVDENYKAVVTFDSDIFRGSAVPEIITVEAANSGFSADPADALFGRIGTFVLDVENEDVPGGKGIFTDEHGIIVLTYFDRATRYSANITGEEVNNIYDINVPAEGFYAVSYTESLDEATPVVTRTWSVVDISSSNPLYFYVRN